MALADSVPVGISDAKPLIEISSGGDWRGVAASRPELSAARVLTPAQIAAFAVGVIGLGVSAIAAPSGTQHALHWLLLVGFGAIVLLKHAALSIYFVPSRGKVRARRNRGVWPIYTILCPLHREEDSVALLCERLKTLDYPLDRLDVVFVIEPDDEATRDALLRLSLPSSFRIFVAPALGPRTKPKALNAALGSARGDFVTIYDAEDAPHPSQIKAALARFDESTHIGCVQAPLVIDNGRESWIAGQLALEYALQFKVFLPMMMRLGLPAPLGGTSNHFRRAALDAIGAWDPHNVTEDADIGLRLHRLGWRCAMISPPTYEEAPVTWPAWRNQRTRWIKGHMQTWLVHMRDPWGAAASFGFVGLLAMQAYLGGALLSAFLHAPMLAYVCASIAVWGWIAPEDVALIFAGYASAMLSFMAVAIREPEARRPLLWLTAPLYWPLATIAACGALWGLLVRPHFWAKTDHARSPRATPI